MLGTVKVKVRGVCPLIQNNPDSINNLPSGKNTDRDSKEYQEKSFQYSMYKNRKGIYQPAEHFERCMELAGNQFKFKGKTMYGKILKGGITVEPNQIPFLKKFKPEHFRKWVVINRARVSKTRAIFQKWELEFSVRIFNDAINFDVLKDILTYGGCYVGVGDWRPKYGRFEIISFTKGKK